MHVFPWDDLHPRVRGPFMALADDLARSYGLGPSLTRTLFRPFEGYRSPVKQNEARRKGVSKAAAWSSPHQYGLAVDFVPFMGGKWMWEGDHDWAFLARCASARGLICQTSGLEWDKPHVQSPLWYEVRDILAPRISGSAA